MARGVLGLIAAWLIVVGAAAGTLKVLDRLPALVTGTPQGARVYQSIREAELAVGARLWLPAYYPDWLAWPPMRIDAWPGPPVSVAVRIADRATGQERLVLVQSIDAPGAPPAALLDDVRVLDSADVVVGGRPGRLTRVLTAGGQVLHDVWWDHGTRRVTIRFRGPAEQLLLIASSLERSLP